MVTSQDGVISCFLIILSADSCNTPELEKGGGRRVERAPSGSLNASSVPSCRYVIQHRPGRKGKKRERGQGAVSHVIGSRLCLSRGSEASGGGEEGGKKETSSSLRFASKPLHDRKAGVRREGNNRSLSPFLPCRWPAREFLRRREGEEVPGRGRYAHRRLLLHGSPDP